MPTATETVLGEAVKLEVVTDLLKNLSKQLKESQKRINEVILFLGKISEREPTEQDYAVAKEQANKLDNTTKDINEILSIIEQEFQKIFGERTNVYREAIQMIENINKHKTWLKSRLPGAFTTRLSRKQRQPSEVRRVAYVRLPS